MDLLFSAAKHDRSYSHSSPRQGYQGDPRQALKELGHERRRPEADYLRDGIYELRTKHGGVHYRMLYFFHRNVAAVVAHGLVKKQVVPAIEIDRAIKRKREFENSPDRHTYREESHAD